MAGQRKEYVRPQPAHRRLMDGKALERMWGDQGLVAQAPAPAGDGTEADPYAVFDAAADGAIDTASRNFMTLQEKREAAFRARQKARETAQTRKPGGAVATVAEDLAEEESAAARQELLDSMSAEERNAILNDLLNRERDDADSMVSVEDDDEITPFNWTEFQDAADAQSGVAALSEDLTNDDWAGVVEDGEGEA